MNQAGKPVPKAMMFWILWGSILMGMPMIYFVLKPDSTSQQTNPMFAFIALSPLLISLVLRWALLPRMTTSQKALPLFIVGMAMAEGCGIVGLILGGDYRHWLFLAGLLGVLQYIPFFASKFDQPSTNPPNTTVL